MKINGRTLSVPSPLSGSNLRALDYYVRTMDHCVSTTDHYVWTTGHYVCTPDHYVCPPDDVFVSVLVGWEGTLGRDGVLVTINRSRLYPLVCLLYTVYGWVPCVLFQWKNRSSKEEGCRTTPKELPWRNHRSAVRGRKKKEYVSKL